MKYINHLFSFLVVCLLAAPAFSQDLSQPIAAEANLRAIAQIGKSLTTSAIGFDRRYEGVKGTPLIFDEYKSGEIVMEDGRKVREGLKININSEQGNAWAILKGTQEISIDNIYIRSIKIRDGMKEHLFVPLMQSLIEKKGEEKTALYEHLFESVEFGLLKKYKSVFVKADFKGAYTTDKRYDEYQKEELYYLRVKNQWSKIKLKKKQISKLLPRLSKMEDWKGTEVSEDQLILMLTKL